MKFALGMTVRRRVCRKPTACKQNEAEHNNRERASTGSRANTRRHATKRGLARHLADGKRATLQRTTRSRRKQETTGAECKRTCTALSLRVAIRYAAATAPLALRPAVRQNTQTQRSHEHIAKRRTRVRLATTTKNQAPPSRMQSRTRHSHHSRPQHVPQKRQRQADSHAARRISLKQKRDTRGSQVQHSSTRDLVPPSR